MKVPPALLTTAFLSLHAQAASVTWNTTGPTNEWNTTDTNWTGGSTVFTTGDDATFNASTGEAVTVIGGGISAGNISVGANNGSWTFSGGSITGALTKSGSGTLTLGSANAFTSVAITGGRTGQTSGAIIIGDNSALGSATITLSNTTELTALSNVGSRTIGNNLALSSTAAMTRLLAQNGTTFQLDGLISGGVAGTNLRIDTNQSGGSTGLIKLTNASNSFRGLIQINRGGLAITSNGALGDLANTILLDIGTNTQTGLRFDASMSSARNIQLGSGKQVLDTVGNNVTLSGIISGTNGQLHKLGSGTLTLTNPSNSYTGITQISAGTLKLGHASALASSSSVVIESGATLSTADLTGTVAFGKNIALSGSGTHTLLIEAGAGNGTHYSGTISGTTGTLFLNSDASGDTTGTYTLSGNNTFTASTEVYVNRGSLTLGHANALGAASNSLQFDSSAGATLGIAGSYTLGNSIEFTFGAKNIDTSTHDVTLSGAIRGNQNVTKLGTGSLTLTGSSTTFSGDVSVSAGALFIDGALGTSTTDVTVQANGTLGGSGSIGGNLGIDGSAFIEVIDLSSALSVGGTISFTSSGFGIDNLIGIDWDTITLGTYTIIDGTLDPAQLDHFGYANRLLVGTSGERSAYFANGSLALVVIPEPSIAILGSMGLLALLRRRR